MGVYLWRNSKLNVLLRGLGQKMIKVYSYMSYHKDPSQIEVKYEERKFKENRKKSKYENQKGIRKA
jgi:hypothetical protein